MFRLRIALGKGTTLVLLAGVLAPILFLTGATAAQTRRTRSARTSATRSSPSPTPIAVPRLPPASSSTVAVPPQTAQTPSPSPSAPPAPQQQQPAPQPASTPPADAAADEEDEVVRVTSNLVVVPVSVTNANGEPVQGMKLGDFRLEEEGRLQELTQVGDADQVPLDIALLFDASSSVSEEYKFQQEAAARFLRQVLKKIDRAAVFAIADRPRLEQPLASADVAASKLLSIPAATTPVPTAFYDTVKAAAKYLAENAPERNRRVIVVLSDGEDNFSAQIRDSAVEEARTVARGGSVTAPSKQKQQALHRRAVQDVLRAVQSADAVFYSINSTGPSLRLNEISTRAQAGMQQLAETTGGTPFVPENLTSLEAIFRQIAAELRAQYLLQYQSNADAPTGKFLKIKVAAPARPDLRIRARQGYYKKG